MDILEEFKAVAKKCGFDDYRDGLARIALIRYYRPEERKVKNRHGGVARSPGYIKFIESLPCLICSSKSKAYRFQKDGKPSLRYGSDYTALPLCEGCATDIKKFFLVEDRVEYFQNKILQAYLRSMEGA